MLSMSSGSSGGLAFSSPLRALVKRNFLAYLTRYLTQYLTRYRMRYRMRQRTRYRTQTLRQDKKAMYGVLLVVFRCI